MTPAAEFLDKILILNAHRNELILPDIEVGSELGQFLDLKNSPYTNPVVSAKFKVGALKDMVIVNSINNKCETTKEVISRSYIVVVGKVQSKNTMPANIKVKQLPDKTIKFKGTRYTEELNTYG